VRPPPSRRPHLVVLAIVVVAFFGGLFERIELALTDLRFRWDQRAASGELVLVEIDAESLRRLDVWPWPREWHAEALERLLGAGARQVAFDIDFSSRSQPEADARLAAAIDASGGRVILPAFEQRREAGSGELLATEPMPALARSARLASVTVRPESDSRVRRLAAGGERAGRELPSLPAALLQDRIGTPPRTFHIDFGIRAETVPRLSFADVLEGGEALRRVAGKDVLLGATAVELGDQLPAPLYRTIPGPVLLALAYESLAQGRAMLRTGAAPTLVVAAALALLLGPWFGRWSWRRGLAVLAGVQAACVGVGWLAHAQLAVMVDVAPWLAAPLLSYAKAMIVLIDAQAKRIFRQHMNEAHRSAMMKGIVENSFDAIVTADRSGRITLFNTAAERLFGVAQEEAVGRSIETMLRLPSGASVLTLLARGESLGAPVEVEGVSAGAQDFVGELALRRATLFLSRHPMERRSMERSFWVLAVRDVTERKRAEAAQAEAKAAAETANRAKTEFLATMSHELRTPLNAVLGFSEMIRDELLGPVGHTQYKGYAGDIHRSGAHLLDIINDILDTAKIEAGKLTLAESIVSVPGAVASTLRLATGRPEGGQVPVRVELPEALPGLWADLRLVKQILLNLLSNALKFTPAGEVAVTARVAEDGWLEIAVRDTGIGIPQSEIAKVLQPFYQVDNSNSRKYQGTGLGLSLVRSLMELHGGELRIESEVGVGTTAICRFPVERVQADVIPMPAANERLRA